MMLSHVRWAVDLPRAGELVPRTGFLLSGWVLDGTRQLSVVMARHAGAEVGATAVPYVRDDVEPGKKCGYRIFIEPERDELAQEYEIELFARFADGALDEVKAGGATVRLSSFDERTLDYGGVSEADFAIVLRRHDVYSVGPPSQHCGPDTVGLLFSYIDPGASVLDVGCGAAPYARPFIESGRRWAGCETQGDLVADHIARGLPVKLVKEAGLPFPPASFDYAICIEVLEHIDAYEPFVAEIARVARRGACFSVPNIRAVPRLAPLGVVPWHLLEATHLNFFTAVSLRELLGRHFASVDTFEYGALALTAPDGTAIFNHIFGVAMHG